MDARLSQQHRWRSRIYGMVEEGGSWPSRLFNGSIMLLIASNVVAIILESVEPIYQAHTALFQDFETFSVAVFSIEYLLRIWSCVESPNYYRPVKGRLRYMVSFMAIIDLLAIAPYFLSMFFNIDARFLRVLRLLRVFKMTRYFQPLEILMQVIRMEAPVLAAAIFVMLVLAVLAAGGIYVVEHDAQPEAFGSIPAAMWWAIVTLTTVGYGDVIPVTHAGKMFAVAVTMLGVGMAALPAGIIAAGFTREMQKRRKMYQSSVREALEDGVITKEEHEQLEEIRKRLGLNLDDAQAVTRAEFSLLTELKGSRCPHCGERLFDQR